MKTEYINETTRTYTEDGKLIAVATNPTWKHDIDCHLDSHTRYFCLADVWDADGQTCIVTAEKLAQLVAEA